MQGLVHVAGEMDEEPQGVEAPFAAELAAAELVAPAQDLGDDVVAVLRNLQLEFLVVALAGVEIDEVPAAVAGIAPVVFPFAPDRVRPTRHVVIA